MSGGRAEASLHESVESLLRRHPNLDGAAFVRLVEQIAVEESAPASTAPGELHGKLRQEARDLAEVIRQARFDIAALNPEAITEEHLPVAGKELEAIVSATECATNEIMEAAETIEAALEPLPSEVAESISAAVTQIYEACSFQDITGQRISKVVGALQQVETKVGGMLATLGDERSANPACGHGSTAKRPLSQEEREGSLMNGPQAPGQAPSQDDIDAMFQNLG